MKSILIALTLALLPACATTAPDVLQTEGALARQVGRLVDRHDGYVLSDDTLSSEVSDALLSQSAALETLVGLPTLSRGSLRAALLPVADRHDNYVRSDAALDDLERETYLASAEGLRRLAGGP